MLPGKVVDGRLLWLVHSEPKAVPTNELPDLRGSRDDSGGDEKAGSSDLTCFERSTIKELIVILLSTRLG